MTLRCEKLRTIFHLSHPCGEKKLWACLFGLLLRSHGFKQKRDDFDRQTRPQQKMDRIWHCGTSFRLTSVPIFSTMPTLVSFGLSIECCCGLSFSIQHPKKNEVKILPNDADCFRPPSDLRMVKFFLPSSHCFSHCVCIFDCNLDQHEHEVKRR